MPKGQRKPLEEKIHVKQNLILTLNKRIESEKSELKDLLERKRLKDLEKVDRLISESKLTSEEVSSALEQYILLNKVNAS